MDQKQNVTEEELLSSVKQRALKALTALLPQIDSIDAQQRFNIQFNALRSSDDLSLLSPSLDAALSIENKEAQANSLLELLEEINYLQDSVSSRTDTARPLNYR